MNINGLWLVAAEQILSMVNVRSGGRYLGRLNHRWTGRIPAVFLSDLYLFLLYVQGPFWASKSFEFWLFNADSNSAFHSNADPDPTSKNNGDPETWLLAIRFYILYPFLIHSPRIS